MEEIYEYKATYNKTAHGLKVLKEHICTTVDAILLHKGSWAPNLHTI